MRLVEWRDGLNAPRLIDDSVDPLDLGTALVRQAVQEGYQDFVLVGLRRESAYFACRVFSRPRPRPVLNDILDHAQSYVKEYLCGVDAAN